MNTKPKGFYNWPQGKNTKMKFLYFDRATISSSAYNWPQGKNTKMKFLYFDRATISSSAYNWPQGNLALGGRANESISQAAYDTPQIKYAGNQILLEFWGAQEINSMSTVRKALTQAVKAAGATLLKIELHKFSPQGISGVAIIAESHISIHTWPEYQYAAIDIFTCGQAVKPYQALAVLKKAFKPQKVEIIEVKRGIIL
jgi:S-adenosylmethionine decarboxylase